MKSVKFFRLFGISESHRKSERKEASPDSLKAGGLLSAFWRSEANVLKEDTKEKERDRDGGSQLGGGRHSVYRGRLRIEELEPKISP